MAAQLITPSCTVVNMAANSCRGARFNCVGSLILRGVKDNTRVSLLKVPNEKHIYMIRIKGHFGDFSVNYSRTDLSE